MIALSGKGKPNDLIATSGHKHSIIHNLVGDFNPFEKYYSSQNGNLPQIGVDIKKIFETPHPAIIRTPTKLELNSQPEPEGT